MIGIIIGSFCVGVFIGVLLMALCFVASKDDRDKQN